MMNSSPDLMPRAAFADLPVIAAPGRGVIVHERDGLGIASVLAKRGQQEALARQIRERFGIELSPGPKARDALCKLVPIDLHPRIFRSGDVAVTVAAHIGVTLWRREDDPNGQAVFEIAVFRSLAESFWTALSESAAEFGLKMNGRS